MTCDLVDDNGGVLFSRYPYADALAEQRWRMMAGSSSLRLIPHGSARDHYRPPRFSTQGGWLKNL